MSRVQNDQARRFYQNTALRLMSELGVSDVEKLPDEAAFWERVDRETKEWATHSNASGDAAAQRRLAKFEAVVQMKLPGGPQLNQPPLSDQVKRVCTDSQKGIVHDVPVIVGLGDLTALKLDALCVPAWGPGLRDGTISSSHPVASGGMSGSVQRAGGREGIIAADEYMKKNFVGWGDSVPTKSGAPNWPVLFNVTTCGTDMTGIPVGEMQVVYDATVAMLHQAMDLGHRSLGVPLLGVGVSGNLTAEQSAQAILKAVYDVARARGANDNPVPSIALIAFGKDSDYRDIERVLVSGSYRDASLNSEGARESTLEDLAVRRFGTGTEVRYF